MPQEQTVVLPRAVISKARSQNIVSNKPRGDSIQKDNTLDPNKALRAQRSLYQTASAEMRRLYREDGLVSTVVIAMVAMANAGYKVSAFTTGTHEFDSTALLAAETLMASWDTVYDYSLGFVDRQAMAGMLTVALLETALAGGIGAELILDKAKFPEQLTLFQYDSIEWKANGKGGRFPAQRAKNPPPGAPQEVELNLPTVFVGELAKSLEVAYNITFLSAGIKRLYSYDEFIEDMRRVVRRVGGPRLLVKLNYEKVKQSAPRATQTDTDKLFTYMEEVKTSITDAVRGLEPEDALVFYDLAEVDSVSTTGEKSDYKDLLDAYSGLTASAMKSNPSALGLRVAGSQNVGSTEAMLFAKTASLLQPPVEQVMSRALTLGIRLLGFDAYVKFKFDSPELRPELELEAHRSIRQNRVLEQLSLGFISDDEASVLLGTGTRPAGAPTLSGTMFYHTKATQTPSPNGDANGREVASDMPTSAGGKDNTSR